MEQIGAVTVCAMIALIVTLGFLRGLPVFDLFMQGAEKGLKTIVKLLPTLIGLITAISMFRASGLPEMLAEILKPVLSVFGIHPDLVPLILLRPVSGSGSLSYVTELYTRYGADSDIARTAAILASATETTFYAAAVYFGGRGFRSTRYAIPAALCGDCAAVILTMLAVHIFG